MRNLLLLLVSLCCVVNATFSEHEESGSEPSPLPMIEIDSSEKVMNLVANRESAVVIALLESNDEDDETWQTLEFVWKELTPAFEFAYAVGPNCAKVNEAFGTDFPVPSYFVIRDFDSKGERVDRDISIWNNTLTANNKKLLKLFTLTEGSAPSMCVEEGQGTFFAPRALAREILLSPIDKIMCYHHADHIARVEQVLKQVWLEMKGKVLSLTMIVDFEHEEVKDMLDDVGLTKEQAVAEPRFGLTQGVAAPDKNVLIFPSSKPVEAKELIAFIKAPKSYLQKAKNAEKELEKNEGKKKRKQRLEQKRKEKQAKKATATATEEKETDASKLEL